MAKKSPTSDQALGDTPDPASQTSRLSFEELLRAVAKGRPRLVVVEGGSLGSMVELGEAPLTIGRDPGNALLLDAAGTSRHHAVIETNAQGDVVLRDLGSKNGTYVNKERTVERVLADGDLIHVGATILKYLADDNAEHSYYQYLHQVTVQDPLTQIPNRRYFDDFLRREIARSVRYGRPLSLLMVDVDHFKHINDTYGHVCGDAILRELAQAVTARLRQSEFLARYGGEEFALVLPETDLAGARSVGESLRDLVERHPFVFDGTPLRVTVSLGGASWTRDMSDPRDLVAAADERLYQAKREGRNRIVV